jgi:hypothetical protein
MPLCEVVATVAMTMAERLSRPTKEEACLIHFLQAMPLLRDIGRLDLWESICDEVDLSGSERSVRLLMEEIIMFGKSNLYQAFDVNRTTEYYRRLSLSFAQMGVELPHNPDVSGW